MITAFCDGACRVSNPGQTSCAFVTYDKGQEIFHDSKYLGPVLRTNNEAEYRGLLLALHYLDANNIKQATIYCDSQLVVKQVTQEWPVKTQSLEPLMLQAYALLTRTRSKLEHIKGHTESIGNTRADTLCNDALDRAGIGVRKRNVSRGVVLRTDWGGVLYAGTSSAAQDPGGIR